MDEPYLGTARLLLLPLGRRPQLKKRIPSLPLLFSGQFAYQKWPNVARGSQIKPKFVFISMIHLLQWTHTTALLIKYLNGEEPIGKCHVLFLSEYTRSFTAARKQIIRPPNSCTFPLARATLCCYISNWNMRGCLCLYSEKSYTDSICSTFGANLQWLLRLKIALEFCLLLLDLK